MRDKLGNLKAGHFRDKIRYLERGGKVDHRDCPSPKRPFVVRLTWSGIEEVFAGRLNRSWEGGRGQGEGGSRKGIVSCRFSGIDGPAGIQ